MFSSVPRYTMLQNLWCSHDLQNGDEQLDGSAIEVATFKSTLQAALCRDATAIQLQSGLFWDIGSESYAFSREDDCLAKSNEEHYSAALLCNYGVHRRHLEC